MYAIVLTYDNNHCLANHMIYKYNQLWPNHPFTFRIPYQCRKPNINSEKVEFIQSPKPIVQTINKLFWDLNDNEIIYWCMDDKYPILLNTKILQNIHDGYQLLNDTSIAAIQFCRYGSLLDSSALNEKETININGIQFVERKGYARIWMHQFARVKVIRHLLKLMPTEIRRPNNMEVFLWMGKIEKPVSHRLFVSKKNFAVYGESSHNGIITENCYRSIMANNLPMEERFKQRQSKERIVGINTQSVYWRMRYKL